MRLQCMGFQGLRLRFTSFGDQGLGRLVREILHDQMSVDVSGLADETSDWGAFTGTIFVESLTRGDSAGRFLGGKAYRHQGLPWECLQGTPQFPSQASPKGP